MIATLEGAIRNSHDVGHPAWLGLLGHWIQMTGCARMAHLTRAYVLKVSPSMVHCHCPNRKQRQLRACGFDFAVPRFFMCTSFDWWKAFNTIKKAPLTREATVTAVRAALSQQVQEVQMLTSYSARRVLPTLAMLVGMDPSETLALSDWQLKPADEQSAMPLRQIPRLSAGEATAGRGPQSSYQ